jgi:hypothetical protein
MANKAETKFREMIAKRKCEVFRAGWPDFLLVTEAGNCLFVEVKSASDRLSETQVRTFAALEWNRVYVRIWWEKVPDALLPWRKFLAMTKDTETRVYNGRRRGRVAPFAVDGWEKLSAMAGKWEPSAEDRG